MQYRSGKEVRDLFIKFWESHGCHHYKSFSLIPDDPSLLFTIAGMVPFKKYYLGVDEENMSSCVVFAGSSADVRHVLCGGDWIVRDRTFVQRDVKQIMEDSRVQRARLLAARSSI